MRFRTSVGILNERLPVPVSGKVLVLSLSNSIYQLKLEAMMLVALMDRGWEPVVFTTSSSNSIAHRILGAVGVTRFAYLEDLHISEDQEQLCRQEALQYLSAPLTLQSVKAWMFHDAWIGPQILSSVARSNHLGSPDPSDAFVTAQIRELLPAVLKRVLQAEMLLARERPTLAIANESNSATFGPFADVLIAGGVNVIAMMQPWRDDSLIFKRLTKQTRRIHPASVTPKSLEKYLAREWGEKEAASLQRIFEERYGGRWILQARNQPNTRVFDRTELIERLALSPHKPIAVVFSHVLWDANLFYGDDLFEDYGEWFVETVRAACANPALNWIIKLHPANIWKRERDSQSGELAELALIREKIGDLPGHVKLLLPSTDVSTLSLFSVADFGVTVRGTAGVELPCFGVPTFTAGTGRYSGLGFTFDSSTRTEYLDRLLRLPAAAEMSDAMVHRARWHALLVLDKRHWPMQSFRPSMTGSFTGRDPLELNLELRARSRDEIEQNGDLAAFAEWVESHHVDYLHE